LEAKNEKKKRKLDEWSICRISTYFNITNPTKSSLSPPGTETESLDHSQYFYKQLLTFVKISWQIVTTSNEKNLVGSGNCI